MIKGYYFITDEALSMRGNTNDVRDVVGAGVTAVQYRSKNKDEDVMIKEAAFLKNICAAKAKFIVNDMVEIALSVDADGVHLGQGDMPYEIARSSLGKDKTIGITVHNLEEAMLAERKGADYLSVGPVFPTTTKGNAATPCGVGLIREIKKNCRIPIAAIGGINLDNVKDVVDAGADAVCAISAVVTKDNVRREIEKFQRFFR